MIVVGVTAVMVATVVTAGGVTVFCRTEVVSKIRTFGHLDEVTVVVGTNFASVGASFVVQDSVVEVDESRVWAN